MTEIEKMQRYIKRTNMKMEDEARYGINMGEVLELAHKAQDNSRSINMICLAFDYGCAKGYRAAKAERRAKA